MTALPTAPGGAPNTFVPALTGAKKKPLTLNLAKYAKESKMAVTPEDLKQITDAISNMEQMQYVSKLMASEAGVANSAIPPAAPGSAGEPAPGEEPPPPAPGAPSADPEMEQMKKYAAAEDMDGAKGFVGGMQPEAREKFRKCYSAEKDEKAKAFYSKADSEAGDGVTEPSDTPEVKAEKYAREHHTLRSKYSKVYAANEANLARANKLEGELKVERKEKIRATRYSKLMQKREEGYVFDPDEEINDVLDLNDAQFEKHLLRVEKYQKVPMGMQIPVPSKLPGDPGMEARIARSAQAKQIAVSKGIPYEQALAQVAGKN